MKDPAVLFYSQDFLTGTMLMTNEQKGKYITLLCLQHQNGKLSEKDMIKVCGEKDEDIWAKFTYEDGHYYNKRMLLESEKRKKHCEKQKENAYKRWNKDVCDGITVAMPLENEICNKKLEIRNKKEEDEIRFKSEVFEFAEKYPEAMLTKFCNYWTEKNKSRTKMRFELQQTFEISRRLATWASRDNAIIKTEDKFDKLERLKKEAYGK